MPTLSFRSHHIPWLFVAGFAVVIAVNAVMIVLAIGSFSGLYSGHARERGLHYNRIVAEQRTRDALHWRVDTSWLPETGQLQLSLSGADSRPLAGARLSGELIRPAEKRPSLALVFRDRGDGHFVAHVELPARGNWDLDIAIEAQGQTYALTRRMFLR